MEQLVSAPPPNGSFGALLRTRRRRALLTQEKLAARAELSVRTVRNLEADRVRSPRHDTVRLLADALQLSEPERETWFAAALGVNHQRAEPAAPGAGGPAHLPSHGPAQLSSNTRGFHVRNSTRRRRPVTAELKAELVAPCQREGRPIGQMAQDAALPVR
jgi:transcriptional regulator with XRE-family HTH domain